MLNIYGEYAPTLNKILQELIQRFKDLNKNYEKQNGERLYEHLRGRIKGETSMEEKGCLLMNILLYGLIAIA